MTINHIWKYIYINLTVVSESMIRSDSPHNHITITKRGHQSDWPHKYNQGVTHTSEGKYTIWKKKQGTHPWWEIVGNSPSVSQSFTLDRKDKVKHYIRIKTHNIIILRSLTQKSLLTSDIFDLWRLSKHRRRTGWR